MRSGACHPAVGRSLVVARCAVDKHKRQTATICPCWLAGLTKPQRHHSPSLPRVQAKSFVLCFTTAPSSNHGDISHPSCGIVGTKARNVHPKGPGYISIYSFPLSFSLLPKPIWPITACFRRCQLPLFCEWHSTPEADLLQIHTWYRRRITHERISILQAMAQRRESRNRKQKTEIIQTFDSHGPHF